MKLQDRNLTLEDFLIEKDLYIHISARQLEEYTNKRELYTVVKVIGNTALFSGNTYVIYKNNGTCYFYDGDNLGDCKLDDPSYFEGLTILASIENEFHISDCYFLDEYDAYEWESDYDVAAIAESYKLNSFNSNGFADLFGVFIVDN